MGANGSTVKARRTLVATVVTMAASVLVLSVVLTAVGANGWVLLAVIAVVLVTGLAVLWRALPLIDENRSTVKSRRISLVTIVAMVFCFLIFTVVLSSVGASNWALPVFLTAIAVVFTGGLVSLWRARGR